LADLIVVYRKLGERGTAGKWSHEWGQSKTARRGTGGNAGPPRFALENASELSVTCRIDRKGTIDAVGTAEPGQRDGEWWVMSSDFRAYLRRLVRKGRLEVVCADGVAETFGDGEGPLLGVKVVDRRAEWRLMVNPALALGELYMDGRLLVTRGDLYSVLELGARNLLDLRGLPWVQALHETRVAFRGLHQRNDRRRARRNIASHYDLDARLYDLFLDSDRQYSCAYFEYPGQSLDDAQTAKKRHIAANVGQRSSIRARGCSARFRP